VEKEIVLKVAKKIQRLLQQNNIPVILTREQDVFIGLSQRTAISNIIDAEIFISLHCNYNFQQNVHGSEIYVLGLQNVTENLDIVIRENNIDGITSTKSEEEEIIFSSMLQSNNLINSINFAQLVSIQLKQETTLKQRKIKQAGFNVLKRSSQISILIELGFLSHEKDEKYLLSDQGQNEISQAIFQAINIYFSNSKSE
jgi:N-acetylmuramoyl-L-alanine amidase